ncbi:ABC-F family ATP-binding cassette domain-containing protein [Veillonella montpellierensis]|uniref:ABC-F family ATP-binding cassette domain-containing protein n=1 Tax=Veillonella montpellierensis TaxID=187328 RepID=UPI00042472D4|nr:ABC-F family ATP-binding cassette domain-containing protein [Veillonella montpellierensis]
MSTNVISLQNVEKSYGTRLLFTDVTMTFTTDCHYGLVGVNGTGKSTFLKMLAGEVEPDKGCIDKNGKASIYYLPQQLIVKEEQSILENIFLGNHPKLALVRAFEEVNQSNRNDEKYMALLERMNEEDGWQVEQEAKIILHQLGFDDVTMPVKFLSGGQRRRLALGQALLYPCELLLLDEPTNHLDDHSIEWLESYLLHRKGGLLVSTHDRYFLDAVCNSILELSDRRIYGYEGSYEDFLSLKQAREEQQAATEEKRRQFLKQELAWVRRGAQARSTKQKARLQRYEYLKSLESTHRQGTIDPLVLKTRLGKTIFDIDHITFSFGNTQIIDDFTYHVVKHDRIGVVGPNGMGKSTFLKLLDGTYEPQTGTLVRGETVRIAHFTQEMPPFNEEQRVLDYIKENHSYIVLGDGNTISAGQMLERFLFTPELHGVPIRKLSGGERRRLYLLKLLMDAPNVLLLDEPTNDLDIPTLEVLEDFLDSFCGVVITVCHDRYFLDRVVDKLFVFKGNGNIEIVHGSYSDYKTDMDMQDNRKEKNIRKIDKKTNENQKIVNNNNSHKTKKGLTLGEEKEYSEIMDTITELEHLIKGLDVMISRMDNDYENIKELIDERTKTQTRIDMLTERWLELEEKA